MYSLVLTHRRVYLQTLLQIICSIYSTDVSPFLTVFLPVKFRNNHSFAPEKRFVPHQIKSGVKIHYTNSLKMKQSLFPNIWKKTYVFNLNLNKREYFLKKLKM
ncbi:hypothetical protein AU378_20600 [Chryseobacterium kwangjuense]|uniref:Uncharacterized protein n=1 Tax=Chryseobacterium kwangjuense TaxID=267125 RepID=A0A135W2B5_9FLAO|nr:hypothetical protein AU378_20600 [Chryseobacterium kwangjuense]